MMKFDVRAAALAAGGIATLAYTLCTAFFALVPEPTAVYVTAGVLHIDSTGLNRQMTLGTVVVGLLAWASERRRRLARRPGSTTDWPGRKVSCLRLQVNEPSSLPGKQHDQ